MKKKLMRIILPFMTIFCLVQLWGVNSAFAYKVNVTNNANNRAHVYVRVQKLFSTPVYCEFDIDPGQTKTCDTHGWCPSSASVEVFHHYLDSAGYPHTSVWAHTSCTGASYPINATCCWSVKYFITLINGIYGLHVDK